MNTLLKTVLRNLRKYPTFSLINIGGLAIGIAASFVLLIYTQRELTVDHQFRDADRIARICTDFYHMGPFAFSQPMIRTLVMATCKDVEDATAMTTSSDLDVRTSLNDRAFTRNESYNIDSSFFHIFSYNAGAGTIPAHGLAPGQAILTAAKAHEFFGSPNCIGKTLYIGKENTPYTVVAVLAETSGKSHFFPQIFLPRKADSAETSTNWASCLYYNYVKLKPQGSLAGLESWLAQLRRKVIYPTVGTTQTWDVWNTASNTVTFLVQPLESIHFDNRAIFGLSAGGNLAQVRLLGSVAILLILLAIINYINLITARSSIRAKEMGLKKTFGAARRTLIGQVIRESMIFSGLAMLLACGLIQVILFFYQYFTGAELTGPIPFLSANYLYLIAFSLAVGILAGIYPAFYLTGERNRLTIRSSGTGRERAGIRNVLVTLQLAIATGLVFVSFIVYSQLHFMKEKDKGFASQGLLIINNTAELNDHAEAFRQMVARQSAVVSTSFSNRIPAGNSISMGTYEMPKTKKWLSIQNFPADEHYIDAMGMHLISGRNFERNLLSDTNSLILNESAVAALGLFNPVGTLINGSERVIGVVKDFNYASMREKIAPAILRYRPDAHRYLIVRLRSDNTAAFIDWLQATGHQFTPGTRLDISFLDDTFAHLADKERRLGNAISFFTILAIILAVLGLIGLTLFTIERRTKEIGIRRVLGATDRNILALVSGNFIRLAAIAGGIALPLSWWLINRWLDNYAYRVSITAWQFLETLLLILVIAFAVIGVLTMKAITANPVKSLRNE
ncbi:MAG TPA: FtsX-like permease family protein [Puia sp.]|nr:FtsX-like permease family protein [Puia sp.]